MGRPDVKMDGKTDLKRYLEDLLASGTVTAAAAVIGDARSIAREGACGAKRRAGGGRVTTSSLFDLASLTKPVMATVAQVLDAEGVLPLRRSVSRALAGHEIGVAPCLARKSLGSLLRHRSGLQPWAPLFAHGANEVDAVRRLVSDPALHGAVASTYSDLGYILWGWIAELARGLSLATLVREYVARPLGIDRLAQQPRHRDSVVECRLGNGRERELAAAQGVEIPVRRAPSIGTVQDGNARFLTFAAHAGLFGSARALWRLAAEWAAPSKVLRPAGVATSLGGRGEYALGWRRRPPETRGRSGLWYGHLGFTGGGVWFCPETTEVRVLLAHRRSIAVGLEDWRKRFLEISV